MRGKPNKSAPFARRSISDSLPFLRLSPPLIIPPTPEQPRHHATYDPRQLHVHPPRQPNQQTHQHHLQLNLLIGKQLLQSRSQQQHRQHQQQDSRQGGQQSREDENPK